MRRLPGKQQHTALLAVCKEFTWRWAAASDAGIVNQSIKHAEDFEHLPRAF
jgi:hypothetical protein